jgi:hypothetical protein
MEISIANRCETCAAQLPGPRPERKKFCNRACYNLRNGETKHLPCEVCGEPCRRTPFRQRISKHVFCSMTCREVVFHGRSAPRAHSNRTVNSDGYAIAVIGDVRGLEHVLIAEKSLGRKLWPKEVVHHINGDKLDNRPENLLVCSQSMHRRIHDQMSRLYQQSISIGAETIAVNSLLESLGATR